MDYKIIGFDGAAARVILRVRDLAPIAVDLPIDDNGNLPTGDVLTQYLRGFVPTWHFERQEKLASGVANAAAIAALVQPETPVEKSAEQLAIEIRYARDHQLADTDWTQLPDAPVEPAARTAWAAYRQSLRDITTQNGFPADVVWPLAPGEEPR
jgi:hypothetical protein